MVNAERHPTHRIEIVTTEQTAEYYTYTEPYRDFIFDKSWVRVTFEDIKGRNVTLYVSTHHTFVVLPWKD